MSDPVQVVGNVSNGANNVVLTLNGVVAGHSLVVMYAANAATPPAQPALPTDSSGQTWTAGPSLTGSSGSYASISTFYLLNANAGTHTLTMVPSAAGKQTACMAEVQSLSSYDTFVTNHQGSNTNITVGPYTPNFANEVIFAFTAPVYGGTNTLSDPPASAQATFASIYAQQNGTLYNTFDAGVADLSGSPAVTATWTNLSGAGINSMILGFVPAGGGSSKVPVIQNLFRQRRS